MSLAALAIRAAMIGLNQAEYTDGIIQLQAWNTPVVFFPPGYPALAWLAGLFTPNPLYAGRLASIAASAASTLVMFGLARCILRNDAEALWAAAFWTLSPILNRWSIRVMTDAAFTFWFIACCWMLAEGWRGRRHAAPWLMLLAGAATLTRYQGLYFVPWAAALAWRARKTDSPFQPAALARWALAAIPWLLLAGWVVSHGFGHAGQFIERASYGLGVTLLLYYNMFETFVMYWPWAITHSLFLLGVIGWTALSLGEGEERGFAGFALITALVFLAVQSAFLSFQYRYLLPLLPLWCVAAGRGWTRLVSWRPMARFKAPAAGLILANLLIMTAAVLSLQRGAFGDLAQGAAYFNTVWKDARLLSMERYGHYPIPFKTGFWSKRDVLYYPAEEPRAGDVILLSNTSCDITAEVERLRERFTVSKLGDWRTSTVPLLPDIMVTPENPPLTSNPPCMGFRFTPQQYYTVAVRLEAKP